MGKIAALRVHGCRPLGGHVERGVRGVVFPEQSAVQLRLRTYTAVTTYQYVTKHKQAKEQDQEIHPQSAASRLIGRSEVSYCNIELRNPQASIASIDLALPLYAHVPYYSHTLLYRTQPDYTGRPKSVTRRNSKNTLTQEQTS